MNRRLRALLLLGLLPGCTAGAWRDRAHDFAQLLEAGVTWGPGMAGSVRVSEAAQLGLGSFDGQAAGLLEGRFAAAREQRSELGVSLLHTYEYRREAEALLDVCQPHFADPGYEEHPLSWRMESDRHWGDVGLSLHVAWIGGFATVKLGELWDALAGLAGFDPSGDDAFARTPDELRLQALALDATLRRAAYDALLRRGEPIHGYPVYTVKDVIPPEQRRAEQEIRKELAAQR